MSGMTIAAVLLIAALGAGGCRGGRTERAWDPRIRGSPERGEVIIRQVGCGACHTVPGIRTADGLVGPPLTSFSRRTYIAGQVPNTPENLVRWLLEPHAVERGTAMPDVGLTEQQARDVASYLYTLE